jgi:deferrochelatase/peroxidase EfeB
VFVAFNQDIQRQFATIQTRLEQEEMVDYITPVGGGYFFAPPGARGPAGGLGGVRAVRLSRPIQLEQRPAVRRSQPA